MNTDSFDQVLESIGGSSDIAAADVLSAIERHAATVMPAPSSR